jgi:hypothetical protein
MILRNSLREKYRGVSGCPRAIGDGGKGIPRLHMLWRLQHFELFTPWTCCDNCRTMRSTLQATSFLNSEALH